MNKTCLGLIVAIAPATLFAQEDVNFHGKQPVPSSYYYPLAIRYFPFKDYPSPPKTATELVTSVQEKLNQAGYPKVELAFDDTTGDVIVRYAHSGRGWTINVRDIKPDDFVWKKSGGYPSVQWGGAVSRKFYCSSEQDAQDIESAFRRLCVMNGWTPSK